MSDVVKFISNYMFIFLIKILMKIDDTARLKY